MRAKHGESEMHTPRPHVGIYELISILIFKAYVRNREHTFQHLESFHQPLSKKLWDWTCEAFVPKDVACCTSNPTCGSEMH